MWFAWCSPIKMNFSSFHHPRIHSPRSGMEGWNIGIIQYIGSLYCVKNSLVQINIHEKSWIIRNTRCFVQWSPLPFLSSPIQWVQNRKNNCITYPLLLLFDHRIHTTRTPHGPQHRCETQTKLQNNKLASSFQHKKITMTLLNILLLVLCMTKYLLLADYRLWFNGLIMSTTPERRDPCPTACYSL